MPPKKKTGAKNTGKGRNTGKTKQDGGWFWEKGGLAKAASDIGDAITSIKPHHIADVGSFFGIPGASMASSGLKMVRLGHTHRQRGFGETLYAQRDEHGVKPTRENHGAKTERLNHYSDVITRAPRPPRPPVDEEAVIRKIQDKFRAPVYRPTQVGDWNDLARKLTKRRVINLIGDAGMLPQDMGASGASGVGEEKTQDGRGRRQKHTRQHGRGEETILTPNSSSYGGIKF